MKLFTEHNDIIEKVRFLNLNVFPSFSCNMNCSYCLHKNSKPQFVKDTKEKLSYENFYNLTQWIEKYRHPDIKLSILINGGEPTLDWHYFKNYTLVLKEIKDVELNLITSFSIDYTKEQFKFIGENYDNIAVSLDGKEKTNDLNRGSYKKVVSNMMTFASQYPGKLSINMTINEDNVNEYYENKKYFDRQGYMNSFSIDWFSEIKDKPNFIKTILKQIGRVVYETKSLAVIPYDNEDEYCLNKYLNVTVLPSGKVQHCVIDNDEDRVYYNLNDFPKKLEINENFKNIPTMGLYDSECNNCSAKSFCRNGCYVVFESGNRDVFCTIMKGIAIIKEEHYSLGGK